MIMVFRRHNSCWSAEQICGCGPGFRATMSGRTRPWSVRRWATLCSFPAVQMKARAWHCCAREARRSKRLPQSGLAQNFSCEAARGQNSRSQKWPGIGPVPPAIGFCLGDMAEKSHAADRVRPTDFADACGIVVIAHPGGAVVLLRHCVGRGLSRELIREIAIGEVWQGSAGVGKKAVVPGQTRVHLNEVVAAVFLPALELERSQPAISQGQNQLASFRGQ